MWDWSRLESVDGCLWAFMKGSALIYAIVSIALGEGSFHTWAIVISVALYVTVKILYHRSTKRDYNRKDSYWSKKDESDDN